MDMPEDGPQTPLNAAITQKTYGNGVLDRLGMQNCDPAHTPGYTSELSNKLHDAIISRVQDFNMHGWRTRHVDEYIQPGDRCVRGVKSL